MKLPRDVGGDDLIRRLRLIGYERVHQTGSHVRIRAIIDGKPHTITIPRNDPLRIGTLHHIMKDVAVHLHIPRTRLIEELFP